MWDLRRTSPILFFPAGSGVVEEELLGIGGNASNVFDVANFDELDGKQRAWYRIVIGVFPARQCCPKEASLLMMLACYCSIVPIFVYIYYI